MQKMKEEKIRASVRGRTTQGNKVREGRGFSREEIKQAGLTLQLAKRQGMRVDTRRKTVHSQNVQTLKKHSRTSVPLTEIKGIGKVAEEELQKADVMDAYDLAHIDIQILAEKVPYSKRILERWQNEANELLNR